MSLFAKCKLCPDGLPNRSEFNLEKFRVSIHFCREYSFAGHHDQTYISCTSVDFLYCFIKYDIFLQANNDSIQSAIHRHGLVLYY